MQNFVSIMGENAFAIIIAVMGFFGCFSFGLAGKGMSVLYNETLVMTSSNHPFIKQIKLRRENGMPDKYQHTQHIYFRTQKYGAVQVS